MVVRGTRVLALGLAVASATLCVPAQGSAGSGSASSKCVAATGRPHRCAKITVLGHRGRAGRNENTLVALAADHRHRVGFETDTWQIRGGANVIFHDRYLARVVDPASMPPGVTGRTPITDLTLSQFRRLRTVGGQPLPLLRDWIAYAGSHHIPGIVEVKYGQLNPARVQRWVTRYSAPVSFYETPKCGPDGVLPPALAGWVTVGAKYHGGCRVPPAQLAEVGYSFVTTTQATSRPFVAAAHKAGMTVGNLDSGNRKVWKRLVKAGADFIIAPHPARVVKWLT